MFRTFRHVASNFRVFSGPPRTRRISKIASIGVAGVTVGWALPATLLDDGTVLAMNLPTRDTPLSPKVDEQISRWKQAWRNAKSDPLAAREATFERAQISLEQMDASCLRPDALHVDENVGYIFKRMGISPDDIRLWTTYAPGMHENYTRPSGVWLAANVDPTDMNNHIIITTALQYDLDERRRARKLCFLRQGPRDPPGSGRILVWINYQGEVVTMEYGLDGRFTLVPEISPLTKRRMKLSPMERTRIEIQADGLPLIIAEPPRDENKEVDGPGPRAT